MSQTRGQQRFTIPWVVFLPPPGAIAIRRVCLFVCSFVNIVLRPNISQTVEDRGSVPMDHQSEMTYGKSNNHAIDDIT